MPQLDFNSFLPQLFWLIISYIAFFLLTKSFIEKISKIVNLRNNKLNEDLDQIKFTKEEIAQLEQEYNDKLVNTRKQASELIDCAIEESKNKFKKNEKDLENKIKVKIENAKLAIDAQKLDSKKEMYFLLPNLISEMIAKLAKFNYHADNIKIYLNELEIDSERE